MSLLDSALAAVLSHRDSARTLGVELIGVFGSVARGEAGPESDVDIAYDIVGAATLFGLGELAMDLQDHLGRKVDLVDISQVRPRVRAAVERDLVTP